MMKEKNNQNINRLKELKKQNKTYLNESDDDEEDEEEENENSNDDYLLYNKKTSSIKNKKPENKEKINDNNNKKINESNKGNKQNTNMNNTKSKFDFITKNEELKSTLKLAMSGIFVFLCFYLLKIGLGYYLRNKLDIDV